MRDAVLLALPLSPLCVEDCAGPDPERFPAVGVAESEGEASSDKLPVDPRGAALDVLYEPED